MGPVFQRSIPPDMTLSFCKLNPRLCLHVEVEAIEAQFGIVQQAMPWGYRRHRAQSSWPTPPVQHRFLQQLEVQGFEDMFHSWVV